MALDVSKMMIVKERTRCRELTLPARTRCREHELRGHAHELGVFEAHRADFQSAVIDTQAKEAKDAEQRMRTNALR